MTATLCTATTKLGKPCCWVGSPVSGLCGSHDPAQRDELRRRAAVGGNRSGAGKRRAKRPESELRTVGDIQALIERATLEVENSNGEAIKRASAVAQLARLALELLRVGELEKENEELRALLIAHNPEARRFLRSA